MGAPAVYNETHRPTAVPERSDRQVDPAEIDCRLRTVERDVRRVLTSQPGLAISGLVVRRVGDGVCLSGVVESNADEADVCRLVRNVAGVNEVMNRLIFRTSSE